MLTKRVVNVFVVVAFMMTGISVAAPAHAEAVALPNKELKVSPGYNNGLAYFTVNSSEYQDALADYLLAVADVATGQPVPLQEPGFTTPLGEDFEDDYTIFSAVPLTVGATYQVYFHVRTERFWHCSIYDPDGCSFLPAEDDSSQWRFTYTGSAQTATPYTAPTQLDLGRKTKYRAHGWRVTVNLTADGAPMARAAVTGQFRRGTHGRWLTDDDFRTDTHGRLAVRFAGEDQPTYYRFKYYGTDITAGSTSRPFAITAR